MGLFSSILLQNIIEIQKGNSIKLKKNEKLNKLMVPKKKRKSGTVVESEVFVNMYYHQLPTSSKYQSNDLSKNRQFKKTELQIIRTA